MTQLKVNVARLNKRTAIPATLPASNSLGVAIIKGDVFEAELVKGETLPAPPNNIWYKDKDGFYYWGGGVDVMPAESLTKPAVIKYPWWISDYGIDKIWKITKGAGVKVAVIDTGLNFNHSDIKGKKNITYFNVINNSDKKEDCMDEGSHGTKCAGMIAAQGPDVFGIAPEADLIVIRATKAGDLDFNDLVTAIEKAIELQANIISVSYDQQLVKDSPIYIALQNIINKAFEKNILLVASAGNSGVSNPPIERYPASFISTLSVGAVDENKKLTEFTTLNKSIDILAPGKGISLLSKGNTIVQDDGSSFSTPFAAGVCALYLSAATKKNIQSIKTLFKDNSLNKDDIKKMIAANFDMPDLGIINPAAMIS